MVLARILKRKDASSVVIAVVVAMILYNFVTTIPVKWASWISGTSNTGYYGTTPPGADWTVVYLYPVVFAILELLVLEVLAWIYIGLAAFMKKK